MKLIALGFLSMVLAGPFGNKGNSEILKKGRRKGREGKVDKFEVGDDGSFRMKPFADEAKEFNCKLKKGRGRGNPQFCQDGKVNIITVDEESPGEDGPRNGRGKRKRKRQVAIINDGETGMTYMKMLNGTVIEQHASEFTPEEDPPDFKDNIMAKREQHPRHLALQEPQKDTADSRNLRTARANQDQDQDHRELQYTGQWDTEVDILVMWTQEAQDAAGSEAQILAEINGAVAQFNEVAENSGVFVRLRLVHAVRDNSGYTEASSVTNCLYDLRDQNDGKLEQVHDLRTQYGADMVALITKKTCGVAWTSYNDATRMFSVTGRTCIPNFTFTHELGHNFGGLHDKGTHDVCGTSTSNYAYRDPDADFRTVLAYPCVTNECDEPADNDCGRVPYFSTPDTAINYNGKAVGSPAGSALGETNNAKRINDSRFIMANHYDKVQGSCENDSDCDDNIDCTIDTCDGGYCAHDADHSSCDDGLFCNGEETCSFSNGCGSFSNTPVCSCGECIEGSSSHVCTEVCTFLDTTMQGGNGQAGNMFDIKAKTEDVEVTRFDIHCQVTSSVTARIYTKGGTYQGFENDPSSWTEATPTNGFTVTCQGNGQKTTLPSLPIPVPIEQGNIQAFYVTLTTSDIRYTNGNQVGQLFSENEDIEFYIGCGKSSGFGDTFEPRIFNGAIHYTPLSDETPSPTISLIPSQLPSTDPSTAPSLSPTSIPSQLPSASAAPSSSPTSIPSAAPSLSPTSIPSAGPSLSPSSLPSQLPSAGPSATPSLSPTTIPSATPSLSPSASPSKSALPSILPSKSPSAGPSSSPSAAPTPACTLPTDSEWFIVTTNNCTDERTFGTNEMITLIYYYAAIVIDDISKIEVEFRVNDDKDRKTKFKLDSEEDLANDDPSLPQVFPDKTIRLTILMSDIGKIGGWDGGFTSTPDSLPTVAGDSIFYKFKVDERDRYENQGYLTASEAVTDAPTPGTDAPTASPTISLSPSRSPSKNPTANPSKSPTASPTVSPSKNPTGNPTTPPTKFPTSTPSHGPTNAPNAPSSSPTASPTSSCQLPQTSSWLVIGRNEGTPCSESRKVEIDDEVTFVFFHENIVPSSEISKIEVEFKVMGNKNRKTKWRIEEDFFTTPSEPSPYAVKDGNVVRFFLTIDVSLIGADVADLDNPPADDTVDIGEWIEWKWKVETNGGRYELSGDGGFGDNPKTGIEVYASNTL